MDKLRLIFTIFIQLYLKLELIYGLFPFKLPLLLFTSWMSFFKPKYCANVLTVTLAMVFTLWLYCKFSFSDAPEREANMNDINTHWQSLDRRYPSLPSLASSATVPCILATNCWFKILTANTSFWSCDVPSSHPRLKRTFSSWFLKALWRKVHESSISLVFPKVYICPTLPLRNSHNKGAFAFDFPLEYQSDLHYINANQEV